MIGKHGNVPKVKSDIAILLLVRTGRFRSQHPQMIYSQESLPQASVRETSLLVGSDLHQAI